MPTAGTAVPLNYGYNWLTGQKLQYYTPMNTGNSSVDYSRIGMWLLGEGEMDGLIELWDNQLGRLMLQPNSTYDNPGCFAFHAGCDAVIGSGLVPSSNGRDQGVDAWWSYLPSGLQPLHYNRWAYYAINLKWAINNPPANPNPEDPSYWADLNPIGLWRGIRCRIFDSTGAMQGYGFTRNPAWQYVDLMCRRKLFPEYNIDVINGADDLPAAVKARFDWGQIAASAAYYAEVLANGRARFSGDYSLSQTTTLQANLTQIVQNCRSFHRERAGLFSIVADRPRASVFTFSRKTADSFRPDDGDLHTQPNLFVAKFRDLLAPACAIIAGINKPAFQLPTVTTQAPHCLAPGDYIIIGGTGTVYDGYQSVNAIGEADADGNVYTFTLNNNGNNTPNNVGAGGLVGLRYSRFKDRAPQFNHHAMQLARGAVGVGIPAQRNRVPVNTDFANSTWDQVARVTTWQMGVALGVDAQPYVAPRRFTFKAPFFAPDAAGSGAVANQIEPGDVVTVDDTLSFPYTGAYEVLDVQTTLPGSDAGSGAQRTPRDGSVAFTVRPYSDANYTDTSPLFEPGWPTVPTLPGNFNVGTEFPLASGTAVFFSGSGGNGSTFELPDGYNANNMIAWASPQSFIGRPGGLQVIAGCDASNAQKLSLTYYGNGNEWNGPVNFCGICWNTRSAANVTQIENAAGTASMSYVELELLGGEKIIFGKGYIQSGNQVPLPTGYVDLRTKAFAFGNGSTGSGSNVAHGFCAYVEPGGILRHPYQDDQGHRWEGLGTAMIVAYKNNMGTWMEDANGWCHTTLPNGYVFAFAGFSIYSATEGANGPTLYSLSTLTEVAHQSNLPVMAGMPTGSMQVMPGESGFDITGYQASGVLNCCVQEVEPGVFEATTLFGDSNGNAWGGATCAFMLLYDQPTGVIGTTPAPAGGTNWPSAPGSGAFGSTVSGSGFILPTGGPIESSGS